MKGWRKVGVSTCRVPKRLLKTCLQSLLHLQLVLVREVFQQPLNLDPSFLRFAQKPESNDLEAAFDGIGNFSGVRAWHFNNRECLADNEKVLDLSDEVSRLPFRRTPALDKI